jgi:hypothetical protein
MAGYIRASTTTFYRKEHRMDALIAGEIAKIRIRELHEDAERWRGRSRVSHADESRRPPRARSPVGEFDHWYLWRFVEPDPQFYCRRC